MDITIENYKSGEGVTTLIELIKEHFKDRPVFALEDCVYCKQLYGFQKRLADYQKAVPNRIYIKALPVVGTNPRKSKNSVDFGDGYRISLAKSQCVVGKDGEFLKDYSEDAVVIALVKEIQRLKALLSKTY